MGHVDVNKVKPIKYILLYYLDQKAEVLHQGFEDEKMRRKKLEQGSLSDVCMSGLGTARDTRKWDLLKKFGKMRRDTIK